MTLASMRGGRGCSITELPNAPRFSWNLKAQPWPKPREVYFPADALRPEQVGREGGSEVLGVTLHCVLRRVVLPCFARGDSRFGSR